MGRFSLEYSSEEEGVLKKRRYNGGKVGALESEEEEEEGEEEDKVSDEEGDEEEDEETGEDGGKIDGELTCRINTDVLDCSICFELLRPPIFQCKNGHTACSTCCPKLLNKCHVCSHFIGRRRCLALEKVIESITTQCQFANNGCEVFLSFAEKASHEETCRHTPLFCPVTNCGFSGSNQFLAPHIRLFHDDNLKKFFYNQPFMITLARQKSFMILLGEDDRVFLLLNRFETRHGSTLSMICIDSNRSKHVFTYELTVRSRGSSLQLSTSAEKLRKWRGLHPTRAFLTVPEDFCSSSVEIAVRIQKSSGTEI